MSTLSSPISPPIHPSADPSLLPADQRNPTHRQVDDEHGFIRFFKSLPVVDDDVIRIFDRGDWYTAHGENANFIARTVCPACIACLRSTTLG